jgi:hypothetical protein
MRTVYPSVLKKPEVLNKLRRLRTIYPSVFKKPEVLNEFSRQISSDWETRYMYIFCETPF